MYFKRERAGKELEQRLGDAGAAVSPALRSFIRVKADAQRRMAMPGLNR